MYRCKTKICMSGNAPFFEKIKLLPSIDGFEYEFTDNIEKADVIIADWGEKNTSGIAPEELFRIKKDGAEVIAVCGENDLEKLSEYLPKTADVWKTPMSDTEAEFRFRALQTRLKKAKDNWQTEQYLNTLIDNIPSLVWFKTKDGAHEKVNAEFCRTVGKSRDDILGKRHAYIWGVEEDDESCIASDNKAMETGETVVSDELIASQNGSRNLVSYKTALYDMDGSVMGTVGCAIDVTKEREFERDILDKNKMFENMFASIDCGMLRHSMDGKVVYYANKTALKILGYSSVDDMTQRGFYYTAKSVDEADRKKMAEQMAKLKEPGDIANIEYTVHHDNGETLNIIGNVKLVSENGKLFYQRYLLDVTEQKKESSKKEHRQAELVKALAAHYDAVFYFNLDTGLGNALYITEDAEKNFGESLKGKFSFKNMMKSYVEKNIAPADRELVLSSCTCKALKNEIAEKGVFVLNYRVPGGNDVEYYQIKAVKSGYEIDHSGVVFGIRNVDEEIRSEMETKVLLENALEQANRASMAKSAFLSNMSHDIRTPMNAIVGFTSLAQSHLDNIDKVEDYLNKIAVSSNHLLNLINDVLDMSRIESGKMQLEEKPCSISEILYELCDMIRPEAEAKHLKFKTDFDGICHNEVICDSLHLNQALLNLLSNAVKYTPEGGCVSLSASQTLSQKDGHAVYIFTVSDNGIGMNEDFIQHIFEPFERERNTTASGIQGTGLGMAITKSIVDMMNGSIDIHSVQGKGTTIIASLELKMVEDEHKSDNPAELKRTLEKTANRKSEPLSDTQPRRKGHILLAEDNELNREIAIELLTQAGFDVDVAQNGQIAADKVKDSAPGLYQVVLMDIQMPVLNGYEATKLIRALDDPLRSTIPIIAMTANAFDEDKREAIAAGMNAHISKPIDTEKLLDTLDRIFAANERSQ